MSRCRDVDMFTWVLLCTLAIAYLQRMPMPREGQNDMTKICEEHFINDSFVTTTIDRGSTPQIENCNITYMKEDPDGTNPTTVTNVTRKTMNMHALIDHYKLLNLSNSYNHKTPSSSITQSGFLSINDHQELPLFVTADIRIHHIRPDTNDTIEDADEQMALMGELSTDDRVGLVPLLLSGGRGTNIVPMARNVHKVEPVLNVVANATTTLSDDSDDDDVNDDDDNNNDVPLPFWKSTEDWIVNFLQNNTAGRVVWSVAVQYAEGVVTDPLRHRIYRPVGFTRQISAYTKHSDVKSLFYKSNQTTLLNDNNDTCGRHFKKPIRRVPLDCKPSNSRGVGRLLSKGVWNTTQVSSFPYTIGNRTFFYGQCVHAVLKWFIQELLPRGKMGKEIDRGSRAFYYKTVFAYSINGSHYLYSHRGRSGTYWLIQHLRPGGKMGAIMSDGNWKYAHRVSLPFAVDGRQYFYGQVESINKWFIKELLSDGEIGDQTSNGYRIYPVVFIHKFGTKQFLYSHDPLLLNWHIQELLPGGKMGPIALTGMWKEGHHTSVPYSIEGHNYFFAQNLISGSSFIQEIHQTGAMGDRIVGIPGGPDSRYELIFSYVVNGSRYIYGHNQRTREYIIRKLYLNECHHSS